MLMIKEKNTLTEIDRSKQIVERFRSPGNRMKI